MWFTGSVGEAVEKSKREKKLFMVFIEGKDDVSKKMAGVLDSLRDDIMTVMKREVVAIKVEDGSENCKHFGKIYPILMVPSTYFISNTGVNLEVIPGFVAEQEFMDRLDKVLIVHKTALTQPPPPPTNLQSSSTVEPKSSSSQASSSLGPKKPDLDSKDQASKDTQANLEEKVAKAQQLLEQIRLKKAKEEEEKAKQQELERIKLGKDLAKAKARREEMEIAELVKEREKEKKEAAEARRKILAQIAADREERRRRSEAFRPVTSNPSSDKVEPTPGTSSERSFKSNENETRIQFRFPDGTFKNQTFPADDPLCALRQFVIDTTSYRNFTLSTSYPKRVFTTEHMTKTLRELELTPSSVLLVITSSTGVAKATSIVSTNIFSQIWALILTPILAIWTFILNLIRPSSPTQPTRGQGDASDRKRSMDKEREERLAKRQRESKLLNRDGNVARLRDNRDDREDDGNTWNGNSTQQM